SGADLIVELGLMKVSIDSEYISANQLLLSCFIICNNGAYHTFRPWNDGINVPDIKKRTIRCALDENI
ncbi:hypothetical protein, partial [Shewanella nanhaiensis]